MREFDCLSKEQTLDQAFLIEASAGTGKTFAIEHLVSRLILDDISISEILIVTFTRASTRDLRKRIHQTLLHTLNLCQEGALEELPEYFQNCEDLESASYKLENALALMEDAKIFTIHSFCYGALNEWAFEARVDFDLAHPENDSSLDVLNVVILDTLRSLHDPALFSPAELRKLMDHFSRNLATYVKRMRSLIEGLPNLPTYPTHKEIHDDFTFACDGVDAEKLQEDFFLLAPFYKKICNREGAPHESFLKQLTALGEKNLEPLILATPSLFDCFLDENIKSGKEPPFEKLHYPNLYSELRPIIKLCRDPSKIFLRLAKITLENVKEKKVHSPDHILSVMQQALSLDSFIASLQKEIKVLVVDEFQDTDPLQWDILSTIFSKESKLLALVGDPKQSIYAFRGADINTFLKVRSDLDNTYLLRTNWRSMPNLIHKLNALFDEKQVPGWLSFNNDGQGIEYQSVKACKQIDNDPSTLTFVLAEGEKKRQMRWPTDDLEHATFLPFIVNEITRLQKEESIALSNMAILVKDRFQGMRIAKYLQSHQIPVVANVPMSLTETEAFSLFESAMLATKSPRDFSQVKRLLSHKVIGISLESLKADFDHPEFAKIVALLSSLHQILLTEGFASFFHALLEGTFNKAPLLHQVASDEALYSDFFQIASLFFSLDPLEIFRKLDEMKREDIDINPEIKRKLLREGDAVHLMTSHLSKGLEFDVVFSIGPAQQSSITQRVFKTKSGETKAFDLSDPECEKSVRDADLEKMRLLYVASTRAKIHQYLFAAFETSGKPITYGSASPIQLFLGRLKEPFQEYHALYENIPNLTAEEVKEKLESLEIDAMVLDDVAPDESRAEDNEPILVEPTPLTIKQKRQSIVSFSSLAKPFHKEPLPADESIIPPGPETGHLIHLMMEKIIEEGKYFPWDEAMLRRTVQEETLGTLLESWSEVVYELLYVAFHTPVPDKPLVEIPPSHMHQEVLFSYSLSDKSTTMKGFADLIFYCNEQYYILDWKMNRLKTYNKETIQEEMTLHQYEMQANIYATALEKYLNLIDPRPFSEIFGGSIYFFLRGKENGVIHLNPQQVEYVI